MTINAGDTPPADELNDPTGSTVARGERPTTSSTTTSETAVLRIDAVPVEVGRVYWVVTSNLFLASSVAADVITGRIRASTAGAATTASAIVGEGGTTQPTTTAFGVPLRVKYVPGSTGNVSFLLSVARIGGTGNVSIVAATNHPTIDLAVIDGGVDPGDTGVDL